MQRAAWIGGVTLLTLGAIAAAFFYPWETPVAVIDAAQPRPPTPAPLPAQAARPASPGQPSPRAPAPEVPVNAPAPEPTGIAVFNPMGTKPIKIGLVVPDDFPLPEGYVRHYQTMDDGTQLPAVLMFHPDAHPKDAAGNPIELPPDRLVPEELAPPGLPIRYLEVPKEQGG